MNKIEELENKMLEIAQEIAELKKGQNAGETSSEWKPKYDDSYYFANTTLHCQDDIWVNSTVDIERYTYHKIFKTLEECQKYCDYRKALIEKSYKFSEAEWQDGDVTKYYIQCQVAEKYLSVEISFNYKDIGLIYFKTQEDAQYMIDNYSEEMLKWGLL